MKKLNLKNVAGGMSTSGMLNMSAGLNTRGDVLVADLSDRSRMREGKLSVQPVDVALF